MLLSHIILLVLNEPPPLAENKKDQTQYSILTKGLLIRLVHSYLLMSMGYINTGQLANNILLIYILQFIYSFAI